MRPPTSVAVTVEPEVPAGTENVHENAPAASLESDPLVQLLTGIPSNTSEARAVETENPVPETVTVAPVGPWPGDTVIVGVVTVNVRAGVAPLVATSFPTTS